MALRRRLEGVSHAFISQRDQTVTAIFAPGTRDFSTAAFRSAVAEADVEVVTFEVVACGVIDDRKNEQWITIADTPFRLRGDAPTGRAACVTGRLNDQVDPYELEVMNVSPLGLTRR